LGRGIFLNLPEVIKDALNEVPQKEKLCVGRDGVEGVEIIVELVFGGECKRRERPFLCSSF